MEKFAFVFPGQGSQQVGMLQEIAAHYPIVEKTFREASEVLGYDLWQLVSQGPAETLNQTTTTQPALLTASVALWRVWQAEQGSQPVMLAGHSLGEYSALVCANALSFADGCRLVAARGKAMQEAVPEGMGAMAAILGLGQDTLTAVCETAAQGDIVSCVNFNAPGQIVIAGNTAAVERAITLAKTEGAKRAILLPVSVPSHCQLMANAAETFAGVLETVAIQSPTIPVIHNVDVSVQSDPDQIRKRLAQQLTHPVRWIETGEVLARQPIHHIVECGPGKVLSGLLKRIDKAFHLYTIDNPADLQKSLQACEAQLV